MQDSVMQDRAVLIRARGRVQGVGYRAWLCRAALANGLEGWVRNRSDGTVEALLHGDPGALARAVAAAREGPDEAYVTHLDVESADSARLADKPAEKAFAILPTL